MPASRGRFSDYKCDVANLPNSKSSRRCVGSRWTDCQDCYKSRRDTKRAIANGLTLIRIKLQIPFCELPSLVPEALGSFLLFQLGDRRKAISFPRRQSSVTDTDGLKCLIRLGRRARWELAHSVNSLRRSLPQPCPRHTPSSRKDWETVAFSSPPPSSPEYLAFVRKQVRRLFRNNWDSDYERFVRSFRPNCSARYERKPATRVWAERGQEEFTRQCLTGRSMATEFAARYKEVLSAGKMRPLVMFTSNIDVLGPLHKMMYRHLSRHRWLLVGPPTSEKISHLERDFQSRPFYTSIDLVSATDNLALDVSETILATLLAKAHQVPGNIKVAASNSLQPWVGGRTVQHGQMMGGYLSFPLLCIHSYVAARWATRRMRKAEFLVNGDDTLIASSDPVACSSYPDGYQVNANKTIWNSHKVAEINSTVFLRGRRGRWSEVRHLRRGAFLTCFSGIQHIAKAVSQDLGWEEAFVHSRLGKRWGFLPSRLGLYGPAASSREHGLRARRLDDLPLGPDGELDPNLVFVTRELDTDEVMALTSYKWSTMSTEARKRDIFEPSMGEVRKSFVWQPTWVRINGRVVQRKRLTLTPGMYRPPTSSRNLRCVVACYTSLRDEWEERVKREELLRWTKHISQT